MKPRAWTQEEVQEKFLHHCWTMTKYWAEDSRTPSTCEKLEGLMHSFLTLFDGMCVGMPGYEVIPCVHPDDKAYHIKEGDNYYKPFKLQKGVITVHGGDLLNDMMHDFGRKHGFLPPLEKS